MCVPFGQGSCWDQAFGRADYVDVPSMHSGKHHLRCASTHARRRSVFDRFRAIAHEGEVDKRVQFTIEELYRVRARGFEAEGFAAVVPALDLVRAGRNSRVLTPEDAGPQGGRLRANLP